MANGNGPNNAMGPGARAQAGMPPPPVTHWDYTHGRDPE